MLEDLLEPFVERGPYCELVRAALERMRLPERLDQLFRDQAAQQYERELQVALCCEACAFGYSRVARFALCVALVRKAAVSMLMGARRAVHGHSTVDDK